MSRVALVASLALLTSSVTGCFSMGGAVIGSRFETDEVQHTRLNDGRTVDVHVQGNHALAGLVVGAVLDAALVGLIITAENAASNWKIGPICTDSGACY